MNPPTPAIVAQSAVRRLPRAAIWLFCLAYVLPGFLGREPWKNEDITAYGVMLGMARGTTDWFWPQVLGQVVDGVALLPFWIGALAIRLLPFVPPEIASRVPFAALLGVTLAATWYGVYHLARLPQAQPVSFAFGGEAQPTDYARTLADAGLLALLACLGLAQLSHEATPDLARLGFAALLLYASARLAAQHDEPAWKSLVPWAIAVLGLGLSAAPRQALMLALGSLGWIAWAQRPPRARLAMWAAIALLIALPLLTWPTPSIVLNPMDDITDTRSFARLLLWFTWPAWPLALWTLWRWRAQWRSPHVALPLWSVMVGAATSWTQDGSDRALMLALPGLACLAAFALPTLSRSVSALIDWFTLLFFTGCALIIWVIYVAMMTGVPAKPAANVTKLAPAFVPEFSWPLLLPALLATGAWVWLLAWRVGRHRAALWKSLVLPAGGATLCWLLLMTLWLPLLDHARSYGPISRQIATLTADAPCVLVQGLTQAQISGLQVQGGLSLARDPHDARGCTAMLVTPQGLRHLSEQVVLSEWEFNVAVPRLRDRSETLLLYHRRN